MASNLVLRPRIMASNLFLQPRIGRTRDFHHSPSIGLLRLTVLSVCLLERPCLPTSNGFPNQQTKRQTERRKSKSRAIRLLPQRKRSLLVWKISFVQVYYNHIATVQPTSMPRRGRRRTKSRTHNTAAENAAGSLTTAEESKVPKSLVVGSIR